MTMEQIVTLQEVIREACQKLPGANTHDTVNWIRRNYRKIIEDNFETLSYRALSVLVRAERKSRPPEPEIHPSLFQDFELEPMQLDREISIPNDLENPINGGCDWRELEESTIRQIDAHIVLLDATAAATTAQANRYRRFRQAAMRYSPDGSLDITIGELRKIARHNRGIVDDEA